MSGTKEKVSVLVCDDSESVRLAICRLLGEDPTIEVVGEAKDGVAAVDQAIELQPDVVTMDVRMPRLDGLGAIAAIMAEAPTRVIVVCDTTKTKEMDLSFRAVSAGALEVIPKPRAGVSIREWGQRLVESVHLMADIPVVRRRHGSVPNPEQLAEVRRTVDVFAIGASTGGPPALAELLGALPEDYPVPILIAQHMAPGFARGLATWLDGGSRLRVVLAEDRQSLEPGFAYVPPDGHDLTVDRGQRLRIPTCEGLHSPSVDRLFLSVATAFGARAGGIILTGMGEDGAEGLLEIRNIGGYTMAQDEASSVVYGMPAAAVALGAARNPLPLEHIAIKMMQLSQQ